jgi:hypothetical protein
LSDALPEHRPKGSRNFPYSSPDVGFLTDPPASTLRKDNQRLEIAWHQGSRAERRWIDWHEIAQGCDHVPRNAFGSTADDEEETERDREDRANK